ncbi:iron chelate uptake ABC transporter family permease subunit [Aerococcaceae bacterium DSM 111020]|nr:iron chelate uptake ABC transporter family permease subunit [Aerococcaceae bacterium DSM 111020]
MQEKTVKGWHYISAVLLLFILCLISLSLGTEDVSLLSWLQGQVSDSAKEVMIVSRIPRTVSLVLSGSALAIAGLMMQTFVQNRFVEPSTTGVTESASLGLLIVTFLKPEMSLMGKMLFATLFALIGSFILITVINRIGKGHLVVVPLIGMILSGIIGAVGDFLAWQFNLQSILQSMNLGDFSGVLQGRYEIIYIELLLLFAAYYFVDRFMIIALGKDIATNLGINYSLFILIGLALVSSISAISLVVAGSLPFLGMVVPNVVSLFFGDHLRETLPLVALGGAILLIVSDILSRLLVYPAEIPVGVVIGVLGSGTVIILLRYYIDGRV